MSSREVCPHCHGTGWAQQVDSATMLEYMKEAVRKKQYWLSPDECVREAVAAELIGYAQCTLQKWRSQHRPLPYITRGGNPLYALSDLADFSVRQQN